MKEHILNVEQGLKIKRTDLIIVFAVFCTFEISYFSFILLLIR